MNRHLKALIEKAQAAKRGKGWSHLRYAEFLESFSPRKVEALCEALDYAMEILETDRYVIALSEIEEMLDEAWS